MFSKFAASTLRLYLQRDNIGLLNENYNYKSEQKRVVLKRTRGLCVVWRPEARQDWVTKPW